MNSFLFFAIVSQLARTYDLLTPDGQGLKMHYEPNVNSIHFEVQVETGKYFAIGFGDGLEKTDFYYF